jgi:hypothetical protein
MKYMLAKFLAFFCVRESISVLRNVLATMSFLFPLEIFTAVSRTRGKKRRKRKGPETGEEKGARSNILISRSFFRKIQMRSSLRRRGGETAVAQEEETCNLHEVSSIIRNNGGQQC